mmetsp:Transcript_41581/g.93967  ORF Transcript_41581/g.93967 Transcript_41581/m.93967 type:complete len:204 (-) Transcript_41581:476-1087(-)
MRWTELVASSSRPRPLTPARRTKTSVRGAAPACSGMERSVLVPTPNGFAPKLSERRTAVGCGGAVLCCSTLCCSAARTSSSTRPVHARIAASASTRSVSAVLTPRSTSSRLKSTSPALSPLCAHRQASCTAETTTPVRAARVDHTASAPNVTPKCPSRKSRWNTAVGVSHAVRGGARCCLRLHEKDRLTIPRLRFARCTRRTQ